MTRLGKHNRNHSFPPCLRFIQISSSKTLSPPRPAITDAPWAHFFSPADDNDDPADHLDYTAGIIASSDAASKMKSSKFRPSTAKKWDRQVVRFHHGNYQRREEEHGFVENRQDPWSHILDHDMMAASHPTDISRQSRPRVQSRIRTLPGHRHSWREPSVEIFTVEEEAVSDAYMKDDEIHERGPEIVVNDYSDEVPQVNFIDDDSTLTIPRRPARDSMFSDDAIFTEYDHTDSAHEASHTPSLRLSPTLLNDDDSLPDFVLGGGYMDEGMFMEGTDRARL